MSVGVKRSVLVAMAGLLWLTGCETTACFAMNRTSRRPRWCAIRPTNMKSK